MRARAIVLTIAVILIIVLTAMVPQSWRRVKADDGVTPVNVLPPGYFGPRAFLPFVHISERCVPVQTVEILGETEGLPGIYTFDTEVTPSNASTPLAYSWDNGDTTASSTRDLSAGEHTIEVTVCNCDSQCVTDDHTIRVGGYGMNP